VIDLAGLAKLMVEIHGSGEFEEREFPADRRAIDIGDYYADFAKIRTALGWEPRRSLHDTIAITLDYFRGAMPHYL
jgi:UDP-glucose 4-epimerase